MHDVLEVSTTSYTTYYPYYKKKSGMTKSVYKPFLLRPPPQLLLLLTISSNYIVKVMKPLYNLQEASITRFAIYYLYYKDKLSNLTRSFVFAVDNLHSLCNLSNLIITLACATKPGLVTKKRKLSRPSIYLFYVAVQILSLILSLTLSLIRLAMFEYLAISKSTPMFE